METAGDIIRALGGLTAVADGLSRPIGTVSAWCSRNSIPSDYWKGIVEIAEANGVELVTYEALATLAARRQREVAA